MRRELEVVVVVASEHEAVVAAASRLSPFGFGTNSKAAHRQAQKPKPLYTTLLPMPTHLFR